MSTIERIHVEIDELSARRGELWNRLAEGRDIEPAVLGSKFPDQAARVADQAVDQRDVGTVHFRLDLVELRDVFGHGHVAFEAGRRRVSSGGSAGIARAGQGDARGAELFGA